MKETIPHANLDQLIAAAREESNEVRRLSPDAATPTLVCYLKQIAVTTLEGASELAEAVKAADQRADDAEQKLADADKRSAEAQAVNDLTAVDWKDEKCQDGRSVFRRDFEAEFANRKPTH